MQEGDVLTRKEKLETAWDRSKFKGDRKPSVEEGGGVKTYAIRSIRPPASSLVVKSAEERVRQQIAHEDFVEELKDKERDVSPASYKAAAYDPELLMGDLGSPESIGMPEPRLTVAIVRHTDHKDNLITPEGVALMRERALALAKDLDIKPEDRVIIFASPSGVFVGGSGGSGDVEVTSRTAGTADIIQKVLEERGVGNITRDSIDGFEGSSTSIVRNAIREIEIADSVFAKDAMKKFSENRIATKAGEKPPHEDALKVPALVFASQTTDRQEFEKRTGYVELDSATVARGLEGVDAIERYLLSDEWTTEHPKGRDIVILATHGQFVTNISGMLTGALGGPKNFPVFIADHGGYFTLHAAKGEDGRNIEEYHFKDHGTGMDMKG